MQNIIIVDLDGTVAAIVDAEGARGYYHWDRVNEDEPIQLTIAAIEALQAQTDSKVVIITGRQKGTKHNPTCCFEQSLTWLRLHTTFDVVEDDIFMRENNDNRPSPEVKRDLLHRLMARGDVNLVAAFDDVIECCDMFREYQIPTFHIMIRD